MNINCLNCQVLFRDSLNPICPNCKTNNITYHHSHAYTMQKFWYSWDKLKKEVFSKLKTIYEELRS